MEVEIRSIPILSPDEQSRIELHSLINVLSVLHGELVLFGMHLANDPDLMAASLQVCERVKTSFSDPVQALVFASRIKEERSAVFAEIEAAIARYPAKIGASEMKESLGNVESVFHVLETRAKETLERAREPDRWIDYRIAELREDFHVVFAAIEKNSHGRYRITYNLARQQPSDYYIDFVVESSNGQTVTMPVLFKDVIRDLVANARKYTAPGGTINVGLYETDAELRFVVQDTGIGIPPNEIETVVHFGNRGSNVRHLRTMGGGFGLTKAFIVTKRYEGRMWIKSELGLGTRITVIVPRAFSTKG